MDGSLLLDAVLALDRNASLEEHVPASSQGVRQFNALLEHAQGMHPERPDIQAIQAYDGKDTVFNSSLNDSIRRLRDALQLRPPGSIGGAVASIQLPPDAPDGLKRDLHELREAVGLNLAKTALLLSGSIAESLLLARHPDATERGPGLKSLVDAANVQRLFGRDILRQLDTLVEYRDLIHPRAGSRNRISPNEARVAHAVDAVRLLCSELVAEPDLKYDR